MTGAAKSALGVECSLGEARWVLPPVEQDLVTRIVQRNGLPEFVARMLHLRGVAPDQVDAFLFPTLRDHFPDPFSLTGMEALASDIAARIIAAGQEQEQEQGQGQGQGQGQKSEDEASGDGASRDEPNKAKIGIFADFDVDGATSAAILTRFFRHFGIEAPVYIPERLSEGYGPSREALESLKSRGAEFVIIADCGITAFEAISAGREMGLEIAVFDHHEAEDRLPEAAHIINPKRKDDSSGLDMLAACGVSFMACVAVNTALRDKGYYADGRRSEPPLKSWMDIVALGTVCDMVPMTGINRLLVRTGFVQMARTGNQGIKALCSVSNIQGAPTPAHAGWSLGPRINAGSRVHRSDLGAKLLSTEDPDEAGQIAWTLEDCNKQRKEIQAVMMEQAVRRVEEEGLAAHPVIVVGDPDWHPGLSGLVAGRLKERFGKPAIVVTYAENPGGVLEGRGSGRSVKGVNMAAAFIEARNAGLLVKGGGHAMAGGFTVMPDLMPDFTAFLHDHFKKQMEHIDLTVETSIDSIATIQGAQPEFVRLLHHNIGPFGVGHPEPVFALANVRLQKVDVLKDKHIRVQLSDWEGGPRIKAMLFGGVGTPLGEALLKQKAQPFHLAGKFLINHWQGRESVEFHIADGALALEQGVEPVTSRTEGRICAGGA